MPGVIQSRDLLRVLVFAAASRLSVQQACQQLARAPSAPTVLGPLAGQLSDLDALEGHVNALLATLIPKGLGQRGRRVAIELLELPYHGTVEETHHDAVCRGKAKQGTTHFFPSATAYAIVRGKRYTLALCRVRATMTMDQVLERLHKRLAALPIKARVLLLARGFYRVKVIRALLDREQPFIMPAIKRGKTPAQAGGPTGTSVMAQWTCSAWTSYTLSSAKDGQVTFDLAVVCHNLQGRWGRHQREAWLYATWGVKHRPLGWIRQAYRRRFGIESSYRQAHQARIRTSSRNRLCGCCVWAWRWCCAMSGCGGMPKSWRSPNAGRDTGGRHCCALPACCCGC
jgi:putative transposase